MPFKSEQVEEAGINLTPMIDVVLLLVIFFMVGTQFTKQETQYEIDLPRVTEAAPLTPLPDEIVVNVARDGTLFLGDEQLTVEELEGKLRAAQDRYADQVVIIRGDSDVPYQNVMTVLNLCKRARITNIQLANQIKNDAQG